ncbi:MAG: hypothetical protein EPN60_04380 [Nevskiaceae bacterium]|nr:MAG: hypothetical protein EPO48_12140 [Nevskiaceae bacterium]TAM31416.1 MAG: hypothetical protein EPN60_04380 [Nevskiaceae bacterium]
MSAMQPKPLSRRGAFTVLAAFGASAADSTDQTSPMRLSFLSNELAPADQVLRRQCAVSLATAAQLPGGSQTATADMPNNAEPIWMIVPVTLVSWSVASPTSMVCTSAKETTGRVRSAATANFTTVLEFIYDLELN